MSIAPLLAGIAELGDLAGVDILNPSASDWMIVKMDTLEKVIVPDTVPKFEFRGEYRVSDYPVEQGAFASYNKVQTPFEIRMTLVCAGLTPLQIATFATGIPVQGGNDNRHHFLTTLDNMLATTDLFNIVTPDKTFIGLTMDHYDYKHETRNGAVMLIVEAWFREVRVTASANYSAGGPVNSKSPSAADPISLGTVHAGDTVSVSGIPGQSTIQ